MLFRGVAKFGIAPGLGPGCRRFESCRLDQKPQGHKTLRFFILSQADSNLPQLRGTRSLCFRHTPLSLRDISPNRGISCRLDQKPQGHKTLRFFILSQADSNLPQLRGTRSLCFRHTPLSLRDISPNRGISCRLDHI